MELDAADEFKKLATLTFGGNSIIIGCARPWFKFSVEEADEIMLLLASGTGLVGMSVKRKTTYLNTFSLDCSNEQ